MQALSFCFNIFMKLPTRKVEVILNAHGGQANALWSIEASIGPPQLTRALRVNGFGIDLPPGNFEHIRNPSMIYCYLDENGMTVQGDYGGTGPFYMIPQKYMADISGLPVGDQPISSNPNDMLGKGFRIVGIDPSGQNEPVTTRLLVISDMCWEQIVTRYCIGASSNFPSRESFWVPCRQSFLVEIPVGRLARHVRITQARLDSASGRARRSG